LGLMTWNRRLIATNGIELLSCNSLNHGLVSVENIDKSVTAREPFDHSLICIHAKEQ